MKKSFVYSLLAMQAIGTVFTGSLGLAFVTLAVYLAYMDINAAGEVRTRFLMMPMMNVLISLVLFASSRTLYVKTRMLKQDIVDNRVTVTPPRVTRYDIMAIIAFLLVVAVLSLFVLEH